MLKTAAGTAGLLGYLSFLILITGYAYVVNHPIKSKKSNYQNGSQYYVSLLVHGVLILAVAELFFDPILNHIKTGNYQFYDFSIFIFKKIFSTNWFVFKYTIEALWCVLLAIFFSLYRRGIYSFTRNKSGSSIIQQYGTELQKLFDEIIGEYKVLNSHPHDFPLLEIALKNNKVYVGAPHTVSPPNIHAKQEYFVLLPFRSGFRNPSENFKLVLDHNYVKLFPERYNKEDLESIILMLNADEILMARPFSLRKYDELNAKEKIEEIDGLISQLQNRGGSSQEVDKLLELKKGYEKRVNDGKSSLELEGPPPKPPKISFRKVASLSLKDAWSLLYRKWLLPSYLWLVDLIKNTLNLAVKVGKAIKVKLSKWK